MRRIYVGKTMYAIFSGFGRVYVQPCKIVEILENGFVAECHNGGEDGHRKGLEFFKNADIGDSVFFSKDSAQVNIDRM